MEKDGLIEAYYRHGRFPADRGAHKTHDGKILRGAGHIETEIKSNYWYEFLQIFAPVGLFALVLYMFYNALPKTYTKSLNKQSVIKRAEELQRTQINIKKQQLLTSPASNMSTDQDSLLAKGMTMYTDISKNAAVRKVVQLPELSSKGLKNEMRKHQPAVDTIFTQKNALQDMRTKLPSTRASMSPSKPAGKVSGQPAPKVATQPAKTASATTQRKNTSLKGTKSKVPPKKVAQPAKSASPAPKASLAKPSAIKPPAKAAPQRLLAKSPNGPSTKAPNPLSSGKLNTSSTTKSPAK
jgi:hypothetical protein